VQLAWRDFALIQQAMLLQRRSIEALSEYVSLYLPFGAGGQHCDGYQTGTLRPNSVLVCSGVHIDRLSLIRDRFILLYYKYSKFHASVPLQHHFDIFG
jgi:hypothetical protein